MLAKVTDFPGGPLMQSTVPFTLNLIWPARCLPEYRLDVTYPNGDKQLFDLVHDPNELRNLECATDPS